MIVRLAYFDVRLFFALESLLVTASLVVHVSLFFMGATPANLKYSSVLFRGAVIVGIPVTAFIKDGVRRIDQIKSCPRWMWKGALILGIYGPLTLVLQLVCFGQGSSFEVNPTFMTSGFPLAFEAISICILYAVLWIFGKSGGRQAASSFPSYCRRERGWFLGLSRRIFA